MESLTRRRPFLRTTNGNGIHSNLSVRQLQIAELAAGGYSNREIASDLKLTEQIVKNVLHSVFDRLGVWNRVELANRFSNGPASLMAPDGQDQTNCEQPEPILHGKAIDITTSRIFNEPNKTAESGMELRDLLQDPAFGLRKKRQEREACAAEAYQTVARVFASRPNVVLQRLVDAATTFCGADSAGISLEETGPKVEPLFRWIAISGSFALFLGGTTPRFFSPCGTTLDRGRAQLYRVGKSYYDYLGVKADPITDGILIPWQAAEMRGTLWVVSHRHREAFDVEDFRLISGLADFAGLAVKSCSLGGTRRKQDGMPTAHMQDE